MSLEATSDSVLARLLTPIQKDWEKLAVRKHGTRFPSKAGQGVGVTGSAESSSKLENRRGKEEIPFLSADVNFDKSGHGNEVISPILMRVKNAK